LHIGTASVPETDGWGPRLNLDKEVIGVSQWNEETRVKMLTPFYQMNSLFI
jgi:hypothetical protein